MAKGSHLNNGRYAQAERALRRKQRGQPLTELDESDLTWLNRQLNLKRPLESYAPRTQRRYLAAARSNRTAREQNRKEYAERKQRIATVKQTHGGLTPAQWKVIERLRDGIDATGVDIYPYTTDEVLADFARMYGYDYLRTVLSQQLDSIHAFQRGDIIPGNDAWQGRGELEEQFGASQHVTLYATGTDPFYYYHGRRS